MERLKEHIRAPSPIYDHAKTSGHHTKLDNLSIVARESHTITRIIKDAMFIRVNILSQWEQWQVPAAPHKA